MGKPLTTIDSKVSLPLLPDDGSSPEWHGWTLAHALQAPLLTEDSPEPNEPQGAYLETAPPEKERGARNAESVLHPPSSDHPSPAELLAPAGGLEAAFAAFHFGADAVYLGLKKFSARAEAENFTLEEVDEISAHAHALQPRRRVFVTINTLIRQDELPELVETLAHLANIGVDAIIIQDLGVYHLVREHFPQLELHASTQLAVHNRAGAEALHRLGFNRVVLARELTFEEVRDITATANIETEVFIHGALCYSYSGLCLFSSQTLGRSGNRGKCAYSCRDSYDVADAPLTLRDGSQVKRDPRQGFPFSMKDLALPDHLPALRAAGVSCFKVEGRKKSPLYVATTTDYYRKLLDGKLTEQDRPDIEAELQTVFSRPWTRLFVDSHKDKEVADRDTVGHRGTLIGHVESIRDNRVRFRAARPLERHDGLQIDLPTLGKPFGFPVDHLWIHSTPLLARRTRSNSAVSPTRKQGQEVFDSPAGALVEVDLPPEHPEIPNGAPIYCSSSQHVKKKYRHERPKPGLHRSRRSIEIEATLTNSALIVKGRIMPRHPSESVIEVERTLAGPFPAANDLSAMMKAARETFSKLGQTRLELASFTLRNDENRFVPVSRLNQLRRDLTAGLETALQSTLDSQIKRVEAEACPVSLSPCLPVSLSGFRWSIKVDRIGFLDALEDEDLAGIDEIIVDIARDHPALLLEKLDQWASRLGKDHIRLALPALTRNWEEKGLLHKVTACTTAGWRKWEAANLAAWSYLDGAVPHSPFSVLGSSLVLEKMMNREPRTENGECSDERAVDLSTDWSIYVINRLAAQQLLSMGVTRFALSPEDGLENMGSLLAEFGPRAVVIVYQDTPQFIAESCAYANLIGGCPGKANCRFESMEMVSSHGERVTALDYHCRTIVLNQGPFCLSTRLDRLAKAGAVSLRADFIYRQYDPLEVRKVWRLLRAGKKVPGGHAANFDRGIL